MDNTEREMEITYHRFIELIEKDIPSIKKEIREENVKIRLIDRITNIKKALDNSEDYEANIRKLIYHVSNFDDSIDRIYGENQTIKESINKKLSVLIQFQNISNLLNPVAITTYKGLLKDLDEVISKREEIVAKRDQLVDKLNDIEDLCNVSPIEFKKIDKLCKEHSIDPKKEVQIVSFLLKENSKIPAPVKKKEKQKPVEVVEVIEAQPVQEETTGKLTNEELEKIGKEIEEIKKYFEEEINKENSDFLDKYYKAIQDMNPIKKNICYSNYDKDRNSFINDNEGTYSYEELAKIWFNILAVRIFRTKDKISEEIVDLTELLRENNTDKEELEYYLDDIKKDLDNYTKQINELKKIDNRVAASTEPPVETEEQVAFFAHDVEDFVDFEIKNSNSLTKKLLNRINNVIANGDQKGNKNIIVLKGLENFDFPTVFSFNDGNDVNIAYIRITNASDGSPRIFILAANSGSDSVEALRDRCKRLLNSNRISYESQYKKIEEEDSQELGIQKEIYDSIFGESKNKGKK